MTANKKYNGKVTMKNSLIISLITLLLTFSHYAVAELNIRTAEEIRHEYKAKWNDMVDSLEAREDLTFIEKLTVYDQQLNSLKQQYIETRLAEYKNNEVVVTVQHQCKGRPGGSTKNCGSVCAERPNDDMFTREDWVSFEGNYMDEIINEEKACFELEAKGNVKKQGSVTATFRYRDSFVDYKTAYDASDLFSSFLESR